MPALREPAWCSVVVNVMQIWLFGACQASASAAGLL